MSIQDNIYNYFQLNPELKVLFVFDSMVSSELEGMDWKDGYKAVRFDGAWFRTKYALENEWKDTKIILLFDRIAPTNEEVFPLMDVLVANIEYKSESYEAFLQQHRLDAAQYGAYIRKHIGELQLQKIDRILHDYYTPEIFNTDLANRGFITAYLSETNLMEWDEIILRLFTLSLPEEEKKEKNFYVSLSKNADAKAALDREMVKIFGVSYDPNAEKKMKQIAEIMLYNAITQLLSTHEMDDYKAYKIDNSIRLEYINKLLGKGLAQPRAKREKFIQALNTLAADIRVGEIVKVYGLDATYFYMPETLCLLIIRRMLENMADPEHVIGKMQEMRMKQEGNPYITSLADYAICIADFYSRINRITTLVFNTPNEYIANYVSDYYLIDGYYRQSLEIWCGLDMADTDMVDILTKVKQQLDVDYARWCNTLNMEWVKCWLEKGGRQDILGYRKQQNIYEDESARNVKQVFIISDALRYEVAAELYNEMAKEKHVARMDCAIAMLPTETKYTKTALLPHKALTWQDAEMAVDGQVLRTIDQRTAHVQKYVDGAFCIDYADWEKKSLDEKREICKRPLVYIFHNCIDRDGHDAGAYEMTRACSTAVSQLSRLVKSLHASVNVTNVVITSDHGFLYNDMDFEDKDKQQVVEDSFDKKTRYYLTTSRDSIPNVAKFYLRDVSAMADDDCIVAVPMGTNRFNVPGGGYSFTHGGASLQEMIIPVIRSKQKRAEKTEKVGLTLISKDLKMVSSRLKFQIIQSEPVSMEMLERTVVCAVYDGDRPVTAQKEITLSSADSNPAGRIQHIELVLNAPASTSIMQLRIYDKNDMLNPLVKENVKNNTIIELDF